MHKMIVILLMCIVFAPLSVANAVQPVLTIMGVFGDGWSKQLQETVNVFGQKNGVEVKVLNAANWSQCWDKVTVLSAAGEAPDVLYGDDTSLMYYAHNKLSKTLDEYTTREPILSSFPTPVLDAFKLPVGLIGLPTALSPFYNFYNVDMFNAAGLGIPPSSWASEKFTWSEMVSMARKMTVDTNGDNTSDRFGVKYGAYSTWMMVGLWDADWVDRDVTQYYGDSQRVISAMEELIAPSTQLKINGGNLAAGTTGMYFEQAWYLNSLSQARQSGNTINWAVAVLPKATKRVDPVSFHGLALASGSRNPDLAWKLMKFLAYDPEGVVLFTRGENRVPINKLAIQDFVARYMSLVGQQSIEAFTGISNYVWDNRILRHPKGLDLYKQLNSAATTLLKGTISVRTLMEQIAPSMRAIIAGH